MAGGTREVELEVHIPALVIETKEKVIIGSKAAFYLVEIEEDLIISYGWLAERDIVVNPRQHGLNATVGGIKLRIPGVNVLPHQRANARLPRESTYICTIPMTDRPPKGKRRALDLFCGRKSDTKVLEAHGYQVECLDNDPKREPTIFKDVLLWEYKKNTPEASLILLWQVRLAPSTAQQRQLGSERKQNWLTPWSKKRWK